MKQIQNLVTTFIMAGPEIFQLTINDINFKVKKIILKSYIFTTPGTVDLYTILSSNLFDNYKCECY